MVTGRCMHWSGWGCTFPDPDAALTDLPQDPGYYDSPCPRKVGGGCQANGLLETVEEVA